MTEPAQSSSEFGLTSSDRGWIHTDKLRAKLGLNPIRLAPQTLILGLILLVGLLARTWEFGSLPPGLVQDEASSGVDAFSLFRFGVDANGISYPTNFISFGSGTNPLYAYVLIPFVALGGLSPWIVRLPMLIGGLLTIPVVYQIGVQLGGLRLGLLSAFLLAVNPWHIMMSRWALDVNSLPFVFSIAFLCLLLSIHDDRWLVPCMLFMGLCLYAYATAYAAVPIFLAGALLLLLTRQKIRPRPVLRSLIVLAVLSVPIALFLWISTQNGHDIHLGAITIPRMPTTARFLTTSTLFRAGFISALPVHVLELARFLWFQDFSTPLDGFAPYGLLYPYGLMLAAAGAVLLAVSREKEKREERELVLLWLGAGLILGVLQPVDTNRINLVYIPLLLCMAFTLEWLARRSRGGLYAAIVVMGISFLLFTRDYHGPAYRAEAARAGFSGLLPAIDYASRVATNRICVTDTVNMPYIYVLFSQHLDPADYLPSIKYAPIKHEFRLVTMLNRYRFGLTHCPRDERIVYILYDETPPPVASGYSRTIFEQYTVYVPELAPP